MLSIEGLGEYPISRFTCSWKGTYYTCFPRAGSVEEKSAVKLQETLIAIAGVIPLADAPTNQPLKVDGDLGQITLTWLQFLAKRIVRANPPLPVPAALASIATGTDTVTNTKLMAQYVVEIAEYLAQIAAQYPDILKQEPAVIEVYKAPPARRLTPIGAVVMAGGVIGFAGIIFAAVTDWQRAHAHRALVAPTPTPSEK